MGITSSLLLRKWFGSLWLRKLSRPLSVGVRHVHHVEEIKHQIEQIADRQVTVQMPLRVIEWPGQCLW